MKTERKCVTCKMRDYSRSDCRKMIRALKMTFPKGRDFWVEEDCWHFDGTLLVYDHKEEA